MKKTFVLAFLALIFASCDTSSKGVPSTFAGEFATIEFWNGGTCIASYKNISMEISCSVSQNNTMLEYRIFSNAQNINDCILASAALAIKYTFSVNTNLKQQTQ